ncbi:hypothetical protein M422DRAFT_32640 [Sphaerobolus stellatus SS14]|uniref:Uncharacterized protein n=1 Tax=Sphaerobolus stellatus (strain SS14) TaxID=990650 RepID=A0A0C9VN36_SPHS4|nr:hypothetical protein M422DRAFT_32640 [Sphaerobolus stellatus SS14]
MVRSVVVIICGIDSRRNPEKGEVYDAVDCPNRLAQHVAGSRETAFAGAVGTIAEGAPLGDVSRESTKAIL